MRKKVVTFEEMVDMAIGIPDTAVNFTILHKLLKLITRYCCKKDYTFEIDMDNMTADVTMIGKQSRSSSESRVSSRSYIDSGQSDTNNENLEKEIKIKVDQDVDGEYEAEKFEKDGQEYSTEQSMYESGSDIRKQSESGSERQKQSQSSGGKDSEKDEKVKKEKEKEKKKTEKDESKRKSSEKHKKKSSDKESHKRIDALEDFNKQSENRTNELDNNLKELTDRIESITQTIAIHLNQEHLAELNGEIDKLKKNMENTSDQCYEATNTINDQSFQIQEILVTINNIELRKVENEELIDLLSGKADHSFVDEKVSISQFEEIVQELKDVINESTIQLDSIRLETNTSLDEIKQELTTKLLAEEFDAAKTKIYKELIKLTEQHALILAQQNEHVAAGAKMRNLNCFVCNNDVVMLLEQETIPKFRPLKASLQRLEPIIGSKILIGKNAPEWKSHLLKAKDFTKTSKTSRFHSDVGYEKATYVKGKNGCMYKGYAGCDCVETMNTKCCGMVEANNMRNISLTNRIKSDLKYIENMEIGDAMVNGSNKMNNIENIVRQKVSTDLQEDKPILQIEDVQATTEITVKVERTDETSEVTPTTDNIAILDVNEFRNENDATNVNDTNSTAPNESKNIAENNSSTINIENPIDGNLTVKTENDEPAIHIDAPIETNNVTPDNDAKIADE